MIEKFIWKKFKRLICVSLILSSLREALCRYVEVLSFLFHFNKIIQSKINMNFVNFEIVFSQIVNVFGTKAALFTFESWQFAAFVALMPRSRIFAQIRTMASCTIESFLLTVHHLIAICNNMWRERKRK